MYLIQNAGKSNGCACFEKEKLFFQRFTSDFKDVYLLEVLGSNNEVKSTKLKTKTYKAKK